MTKIKAPVQISLRLPPDLDEQVIAAAASADRSRNNFIVQAIREKLSRGDWLDHAVDAAKRSKDDGK